MANDPVANTDQPQTVRQQVDRARKRAETHGRIRFFLRLEGTSVTVSVILLLFKYGFPWFPTEIVGFTIFAVVYGMILVGYNGAHRNVVESSTEDRDLGRDDLIGKDTLFSTIPLIVYGLIFAVTIFGLVLKYQFHAFDENTFWNRFWEIRLIGPGFGAWAFWILSIPPIWMFVGDLVGNQKLEVRLTRRGGMQNRNEHTN